MGPVIPDRISKRRTAGIRLTPRSTNPYTAGTVRGRSSMVEPQSSKLTTRVRFSSPAPPETVTLQGISADCDAPRETAFSPGDPSLGPAQVRQRPANDSHPPRNRRHVSEQDATPGRRRRSRRRLQDADAPISPPASTIETLLAARAARLATNRRHTRAGPTGFHLSTANPRIPLSMT
jgi:hypothetical protein